MRIFKLKCGRCSMENYLTGVMVRTGGEPAFCNTLVGLIKIIDSLTEEVEVADCCDPILRGQKSLDDSSHEAENAKPLEVV